jgi:hypothetical protein
MFNPITSLNRKGTFMKPLFNRRSFLVSLLALPFGFLSALALAVNKIKTVTTTEAEATKSLVKEKDAMPAALKYQEVAEKAATRTNKESKCSNCMHYSKAITADEKDILVKGSGVGACALFNGGKGYAKAGGWCMSWFQLPA